MMWDDHDIRDGWGSVASDSPTLLARYPARQGDLRRSTTHSSRTAATSTGTSRRCHNPLFVPGETPPNIVTGPPPPGDTARDAVRVPLRAARGAGARQPRRARRLPPGARDADPRHRPVGRSSRTSSPSLDPDVEALAIVTPTPIASMDPDGQAQRLLGDRTDDVEKFKRGNAGGRAGAEVGRQASEIPLTIANVHLSRLTGMPLNLGNVSRCRSIDEARDQWSHKFSRGEQMALLRQAGAARLVNAAPGPGRDAASSCPATSTSAASSTSRRSSRRSRRCRSPRPASARSRTRVAVVGTFLDEKVPLGGGFTSTLRDVVRYVQLRRRPGRADGYGRRDHARHRARGQLVGGGSGSQGPVVTKAAGDTCNGTNKCGLSRSNSLHPKRNSRPSCNSTKRMTKSSVANLGARRDGG